MKNILSSKKVLLISSLIGAAIIPMTTLTSCANTKVFFIPVQTGSAIEGPYSDALSTSHVMCTSSDAFSSTPDDLIGDDRNNTMSDYLPSNYVYDSNSGAMYGYGSYEKMTDDVYNGDSTKGWNLPVMPNYLSSDGKKFLSSKNADIWSSIIYSNNTAYTLRSYAQYMLTYMFQTGIVAGTKEHQDTWWNTLFSGSDNTATEGLNHGDKDNAQTKDQNTDFHSFMYDLQNLLGEGKNNIEFGVDNVQWKYESSLFGPGPLLASNELKYYENDGVTPGNTSTYPMTGAELLTTNLQNLTIGSAKRSSGYVSPYVTYYKDNGQEAKYDGSEANLITSAVFNSVPVLIHPSTVDFTFYNYIDKQSFAPTDWKITDINKVNKQAAKANAWRNFKNDTGVDNNVGSLNWRIDGDNEDNKQTSLSLASPISDSKVLDYGLKNITRNFGSGGFNNLNANDFVGLANYRAVVEPSENGGDPIIRPYCDGVTDVYPILSLFKGTNTDDLTFDDSILSSNPVYQTETDVTNKLPKQIYSLDKDLLDKKLSKSFTQYYSKAIKKDETPKTDDDSLYSMLFTKFLLGNMNDKTDSSVLFKKL